MARARNRGRLRSLFRFVATVLALSVSAGVLVVLAVTYGDRIVPSATSATDAPESGNVLRSTAVPRDCSPQPPTSDEPIDSVDPETILIELSRRHHICADRVVVAGPDPVARRTAAAVASAEGAAFLLSGGLDSLLGAELTRLAPKEVVLVGVPAATADTLTGPWEVIERAPDPATQPSTTSGGGSGALWVVRGDEPGLGELLSPVAARVDARVVELPPPTSMADQSGVAEASESAARIQEADTIQLIGSFTAAEVWRLELARTGVELPGGGITILPDRRYIAFYGAPGTSLLGVLGEQDPAATLDRMEPLLAQYRVDDGVVVVPTFELIATVAASEAGDDGDYSNETPVSTLRPYVDYAAANGVYVLLDLQPGRTDFLTQAKRYEELLVEPHVGLALDPEWRLGPDQFHLRQLGSVDAAEVNEVSAWLADLVRKNVLPQKMLLIHQFKQSMITNRSAITERPELSMVIQMDGQGPLGTKYGTLAAVVRGSEDGHWRWGWKNFYDEDTPMATPAQTLAVDPQPVYVSYQ